MVKPEDIGYELEIQENVSSEDLEKEYWGNVLMWVSGSTDASNSVSKYRILLQYKDVKYYYEKYISVNSPNKACLCGIFDVLQAMQKPSRVYVIAPITLGFEMGFSNKGVNKEFTVKVLEEFKNKNCSFTEVRLVNGANIIKKHIATCSKTFDNKLSEENRRKKEHVNDYKQKVFAECLAMVSDILHDEGVDERVINRVLAVKPSLLKIEEASENER